MLSQIRRRVASLCTISACKGVNGSSCHRFGMPAAASAIPHSSQRHVATRGVAASAGPVAPVAVPDLEPFFSWVRFSAPG